MMCFEYACLWCLSSRNSQLLFFYNALRYGRALLQSNYMNSILQILRSSHQQSSFTIAQLLSIAESEYEKLEAGTTALTREQAFVLAKFYKIDIGDLIRAGDVNYNTGTHSRGIFNVTNYYEKVVFNNKGEE